MENRKKVGDIAYYKIVRDALSFTWEFKFLWWFGFFIALGSPAGSFNLNFPWKSETDPTKDFGISEEQVGNFLLQHIVWIVLGIVAVFSIFAILYVLGKITRGALIRSVKKIGKKETINFKVGFAEGKKYFWKILGLDLLLSCSLFAVAILVFTPPIILFVFKAYIAGTILIILSAIILVGLAVLSSFLRRFGHLYIVLANLSIWNSIENAYALFRKNFWTSIVMWLINWVIGMIFGMIFLAALFIFALICLLPGFLIYYLLHWVGVIVFASVVFLIILAAVFILRSFMEVLLQNILIFFFLEIATEPKKEAAVEPVQETQPKTKPAESVNMTEEN